MRVTRINKNSRYDERRLRTASKESASRQISERTFLVARNREPSLSLALFKIWENQLNWSNISKLREPELKKAITVQDCNCRCWLVGERIRVKILKDTDWTRKLICCGVTLHFGGHESSRFSRVLRHLLGTLDTRNQKRAECSLHERVTRHRTHTAITETNTPPHSIRTPVNHQKIDLRLQRFSWNGSQTTDWTNSESGYQTALARLAFIFDLLRELLITKSSNSALLKK